MTVDITFRFRKILPKKGCKKAAGKAETFRGCFFENALLEIQFFRREVPRYGVACRGEEQFAEHPPEKQQFDDRGRAVNVQIHPACGIGVEERADHGDGSELRDLEEHEHKDGRPERLALIEAVTDGIGGVDHELGGRNGKDEIAEKLNLPLGTVKSRIFFTRQKLQEELKDFR